MKRIINLTLCAPDKKPEPVPEPAPEAGANGSNQTVLYAELDFMNKKPPTEKPPSPKDAAPKPVTDVYATVDKGNNKVGASVLSYGSWKRDFIST